MRRRGGFSQNEILNRLFSNMRPDYKLTVRREQFQTTDELIRLAEGYESYLRDRKNFRPPPNPAQSLVSETAYDPRNRLFRPYKVDAVETKLHSTFTHATQPSPYQNSSLNHSSNDHKRPYHYDNLKSYNRFKQSSIDFGSQKANPKSDIVPFRSNFQSKPNFPASSKPAKLNEVDSRDIPQSSTIPICWNCEKRGHRFRECNLPKVIRCFNCKSEGVLTTRCPCRSENSNRDRYSRGGPSLGPQTPPLQSGKTGLIK